MQGLGIPDVHSGNVVIDLPRGDQTRILAIPIHCQAQNVVRMLQVKSLLALKMKIKYDSDNA